MPVTLVAIDHFFRDLRYLLSQEQLNHLFFHEFDSGVCFKRARLISWVQENFGKLVPYINRALSARKLHERLNNLK